MNSPVARFSFCVALVSPLCALAQFNPPPVDRTMHLTLLPGPTMTATRTTISSGAPVYKAVELISINGVPLARGSQSSAERIAELELRAAQDRLEQAEAKVEALRAERDALLARKKALEAQRQPPVRFDAQPLSTPTQLAPPRK